MGRVFTWDEISKGQVPEEEHFQQIIEQLAEALAASSDVVGATICGSMITEYTQRSDIDCVLIYEPGFIRAVQASVLPVEQEAARLYVPLDLIPVSRDLAQNGLHHITLSFGAHLRYAAKGKRVIKKDPMSFLNFVGKNPWQDVTEYLLTKIGKLEKGILKVGAMDERDECAFFEDMLRMVFHVARKMLFLKHVKMPNDSKRMISEFYPQIAPPEQADLFWRITGMDVRYGEELKRLLLDPGSSGKYRSLLNELRTMAHEALRFNHLVLSELTAH